MIWLIKFLIFGPQCKHAWKELDSIKPFSNEQKFIYCCEKCGKIKKTSLIIRAYE